MIALSSGLTRVRVTGTGRPFIWTHGFLNSVDVEEKLGLAELLLGLSNTRLVRYDARGHGCSEAGRDEAASGWPALGVDLLELISALDLERPVAGGASMGVATTLYAAARAPDRFAGLVLLIPPTAWQTRKQQADLYRGGAALVEARGVEGYLEATRAAFRMRPLPGFTEAMLETMLDGMRAKSALELARLLRAAAASDLPEPAQIRALEIPALVIATRDDPGHPLSSAERLVELMPDAELLVLSDLREAAGQRATLTRFLERAGS
jgi:pimeloyl-ACP methyl ester carboxylesterase